MGKKGGTIKRRKAKKNKDVKKRNTKKVRQKKKARKGKKGIKRRKKKGSLKRKADGNRSAPLHAAWLGNILEDDTSSSLGLVLHQLHPVGTLLVRALLEEGGKSRKSLVITVEVRGHGQVDIAGVELHVDLLVDE